MPGNASARTMEIAAADDPRTQRLGFELQMCRRSRSTYKRAWFPNTSVTNANVCNSVGPSPSSNFPAARIAVENASLHSPRVIAAPVMFTIRHRLGLDEGLALSVVSDM